ncbi:PEP-CTERM sorting domain-containing protein [bacterium]|nr:PEP-CTERM sorting domain-containing protein [bacterium]
MIPGFPPTDAKATVSGEVAPIPEPGTILLFGMGFVSVLLVAYRRRKA